MDYLKKAEQELNRYKSTVSSIEILPQILRKNKIEIYAIEKALNRLEPLEKEIIHRICIEGEEPSDIAKEKGFSLRKMYYLKNSAIEKFTRMMYGTKIYEEEVK